MTNGTLLYIGGFELPDKNAAAHRVLSNGKAFRELGFNVVFVDVDKSLSKDSNILNTKKIIQGFECWSLPYPKSTKEWMRYLMNIDQIKILIKMYRNVKVVSVYNYPALSLYKLKSYCTENSIKIISDCTEWYSTKGSNFAFKIIKGFDSFIRMRILQKQLDGLIVISRYLEMYYSKCKNVVRIPPLVDKHEEKWSKVLRKTVNQNDKLQLVYSGSPGRNKDKINYIIDALYKLKEFDNYRLEIIGISKEQFEKDYPEYIDKVKSLNNKVFFIGRVSHEESLQKLGNADCSIFFREITRLTMAGFPTKLVESMSLGVPVITNDTSDISEYIRDNKNGYIISSFDANEICSRLKLLFCQNKKELIAVKNRVNIEELDLLQIS